MHNAVIAAPGAQEAIIPSYGANTAVMATERPHKLALGGVPDLQVTCVRAYSEKCAITRPLDASHTIVWPDVVEFGHLAREGRPEVDAGPEADSKDVLRGPVPQV